MKKLPYLLFAVMLAGIIFWLPPLHAAGINQFQAKITAELQLLKEDDATIDFTGEVYWKVPRLRIQAVNALTTEEVVFLVNFEDSRVFLLYPDTLNGIAADLGAFAPDDSSLDFRNLLEGSESELPQGWKQITQENTELEGEKCVFFQFETDKGVAINLWRTNENIPIRLIIKSPESPSLSINISDFDDEAELDDSLFSFSKDYTVVEWDEKSGKRLMPL